MKKAYRGLSGLEVCLAVVAQWQSTDGSNQRRLGFDSRQLAGLFGLITSEFVYELLAIFVWALPQTDFRLPPSHKKVNTFYSRFTPRALKRKGLFLHSITDS